MAAQQAVPVQAPQEAQAPQQRQTEPLQQTLQQQQGRQLNVLSQQQAQVQARQLMLAYTPSPVAESVLQTPLPARGRPSSTGTSIRIDSEGEESVGFRQRDSRSRSRTPNEDHGTPIL